MDNNITVVVVSREPQESRANLIAMLERTCKANLQIIYMYNNGCVGLTKIYNEMLERASTDIVCFIHDDIEFLKDGWGAEVLRLFDQHQDYGIIGVAGSAEFHDSAAWWTYKDIYGQVLHRSGGKSWLTTFSPLLKEDLQEVCVIDGLFMAVHKKRITKRFDEDFDQFNFYDISFCTANFLDGGTKIGVTTNIRIAHSSIGETKQNWFDSKELYLEKYSDYLPLYVKKK